MTERTKLVVRHLPPGLPEEIFWKTLSPWIDPIPIQNPESNESTTSLPPKCTVKFKYYVPGKVRKNKNKVDIPSRAYIQFATPEQVIEFNQGYANQAFRDSKGTITYPKVEFSPHQKLAGQPKKVDARINTIESDPEYIAFLKKLEQPQTESEAQKDNEKSNGTEGSQVEEAKNTPLLEHLRNARREAQEAALAAKQQKQRQNASSNQSTSKKSSNKTLPVQPQIMKRAPPSQSSSSEQKPQQSSSSKAPFNSSSNQTSTSTDQNSGSKKVSKSQKASPTSKSSTSNQPNNNSSSSKKHQAPVSNTQPQTGQSPHKSKRSQRGANEDHQNNESPQPKGQSSAIKSTDSKIQLPSKKNPTNQIDESDSRGAHDRDNQSLRGTGKFSGGGRGGSNRKKQSRFIDEGNNSNQKGISNSPVKSSSKNSPNPNPSKNATSTSNNNNSSGTSSVAGSTNKEQTKESNNETRPSNNQGKISGENSAGARRNLGMALAGITSSNNPKKSSLGSNQNKKPASKPTRTTSESVNSQTTQTGQKE